MPAKQVQQQTFNDIVREAMEEFGLSAEEAVVDAKEQLTKTGITDFSNITTNSLSASSSNSDDLVHGPISALTSILDAPSSARHDKNEQNDNGNLLGALTELAAVVDGTESMSGIAGARGAIELTVRALERAGHDENDSLFASCCSLISTLCMRDDANRARFAALPNDNGVIALNHMLNALAVDIRARPDGQPNTPCATLLPLTKAVMAVQRRSESVKQRIAEGEGLSHFVTFLQDLGTCIVSEENRGLAKTAMSMFSPLCVVLRQFLTPDDVSVQVSEGFSRARALAGASVVTESGLCPLQGENMIDIFASLAHAALNDGVVTGRMRQLFLMECISTTRACAQTDEICKQLFQLDLHDVCFACLNEFSNVNDMVYACLRFLRNLSARDECKSPLFAQISILRGVADHHATDCPKIAEAFCSILAQLCLRRVDIARDVAASGLVDSVIEIMRVHASEKNVLIAACQSVRSVCSRDDVARRRVRDIRSAESVLRAAWCAFPRECDIAYYALREMDVLADDELRRDERYTMPAGFYSTKRKAPQST